MTQSTLQTTNDTEPSPTEIAQELASIVDDATVGYGDRYPKPEHESLVADKIPLMSRFRHAEQEAEIAFDNTSFFSPNGHGKDGVKEFVAILRAVGLDPVNDYVRVFCDMGYDRDRDHDDAFVHVWVNDELLIHGHCNPITGYKNGEYHQTGYGSYMGVGGRADAVNDAEQLIKENQPKDWRSGELFF